MSLWDLVQNQIQIQIRQVYMWFLSGAVGSWAEFELH